MIYRHKPSGKEYRVLMEAFDVQEQRPSIVYISLETGAVFVRDKDIFLAKFLMIEEDCQAKIVPTGLKDPLQEQLRDIQGNTL